MEMDNKSGSVSYILKVCSVAALGGLLFGYDTAVIAGAIPFLTAHFQLNDIMLGWAVSSVLVGCIIGAATAGAISDKFGRKKVLIGCAFLFAVSAIWSGLAVSLYDFVFARWIGGLGVGAASMLSPMYISEISPAKVRGRLVSLNQLTIVIGMLTAYGVDYALIDIGDTNWRWMFASETLPAVAFFVLLFTVPESPRWLVKQQKQDQALSILSKVGGSAHAQSEMLEIKNALTMEKNTISMLFQPRMRIALIIGIALAILQQVTGINIILYYAPKIFENMGFERNASLLNTVAVGAANLIATFIAITFVDKLGRKLLLLIGSAGMGLCLMMVGISMQYGIFNDLAIGSVIIPKGYFIIAFIVGYIAFFASSLGPIVWVVMSEIFPTKIRGRAMSISTVALWIACFGVSIAFPVMLERLPAIATFGIFAAMCAIMFVFTLIVLPETKGKTLEEIEKTWIKD